MYIKEIKVNGFKSFADKTLINLNKTFTGIVGPNGSGKSNIVDAIKWVLGEQSVKTLRGSSNMTDVIFNGSKSRPASNYASVTIVFDNVDHALPVEYDEVSIKRMVYKSGDNEYYLNNEKCRLKDISDLLVDTFSSKESFNIIPQNKIDEILSDRPEERRTIFEEAAGVLKYRKRKEEALRKLDRTHENIERIEMIINELKEQVLPLEKESIKATEYKSLKEKLESTEVALIAHDITNFNNLLNESIKEKESIQNKLSELGNSSSKENTSLEKNKLSLLKIEEEIQELQKKLLEITNELSNLNSKKELIKERSKYDKNTDKIKSNLINLNEKQLKLKNDIKSLELDVENLNKTEEDFNNKIVLLTSELSELSKKRVLTNSQLETNKKKELELKSKIEILNSNIENNSKVPYSVKTVLESPVLKGIENTIGNIIDTEEKYLTMLDVSLGSSSNFIITDNEENAKEAINYLKVNNKGRVTFFPLNVIKPRSVEPEVIKKINNINGFVGIASDLTTYDKKYYNIIMNQLGNIIVADNIDSAITISKLINHRYRVVTLDGELLHIGGSLTGGSFKSNSLISERYEIEKINNELNILLNQISTLEKEIKEIDYNIDIIKNKVYQNNVDLVKIQEQNNTKKTLLFQIKETTQNITDEIKTLKGGKIDEELKHTMDEYYDTEKKKIETEKILDEKQHKKRELNDLIVETESKIKKENESNNIANSKLNEIELNIVKYNMTLDNLLNKLNEEYNLTYEGAIKSYILEIDINEARNITNEIKKKLKVIGNVNLRSIEEYERVNKRYTFLNTQKEDLILSETNLLEIINEMDEIMAKNFSTTFESINKEFNRVFIKLFGGGEAHLKLTDPSQILTTGIEIVAIPSGKTLKPISLLSGGEKTLTAISLLFAIMNLKNVPFAVLDEVESALDEVNAEKFGEYLRNYKDKTQILIITHKKKTMEYVDLLYGITMQESGVSKLVSVKLEEIK